MLKILYILIDIWFYSCHKYLHGLCDTDFIIFRKPEQTGGFYGTDPALKNHANVLITLKDFLTSSPKRSILPTSNPRKISPDNESLRFPNLSLLFFPLQPVARVREWRANREPFSKTPAEAACGPMLRLSITVRSARHERRLTGACLKTS